MSVSPSVCGQKAPPQAVLHLMSFVILWDPMPCEPFLAPWLKLSSGIDTDSDVDWIGMRWCPLVGSNATDSDMSPYRQIVTSAVILQPVVQSALYRCTGSYRCSVVPRCSRSKLVIPGVLWNADLHVCSPSRRQEPPWSMVALCLPLLPCRWSLLPPDLVGAQHFVRAPFAGVSPRTILWVFWCVQKSRIGCSGPATTSIPTTSWGSCGIDLTTTCSHRRPPWLDPWDCDAIHEDVLLVPWRNKPHWYSVAYLPPLSHSLHCHLHMSLSHVSQFHPISPTMRWDLIQFLHGPSSSCVHEEPHHSVLTPTSASNSCARNTCIGRSGTWARSLHTLSFGQVSQSSYDNTQVHLIDGLLSHLVLHLVPFVKGLLGFLFLGLCRLIVRSLPGQHTPLGRSARALTRGAPEKVFRAFAVCSPALCSAARVLNSKATDKMWKPERTARKRCRLPAGGFLSGFILRILALPVLVQSGSEEATVLHHIHDAITASQPDELPSTSVSAVPPEELQVPRNAAVGESSREPLQLMVARCQDESHLEAYGESLDPPMLRICILIPGRQNIILRLPSAEGGAPSVLAQARQQAEHLLEESCDLVPITHQALVGVLTIVAVPKWVKASLRSVVVFDLSAIGGPLFADIVWQLVYRSEVEALATPYHDARVNVFTQNCPVGWASGTPYKLFSGQVIQVQWPDTRPQWRSLPSDSLWPLWTRYEPSVPECTSWDKWLIVREDGASLLKKDCCDSTALYQAVADQVGCDVSQLCFQRDPHGLAHRNFTFRGKKVKGIVAVAPRDTGPVEVSFTFVDARKVGRGVRAFLRNVWVEASSILRCIDPKVPPGYSVSLCTCACAALDTGELPWDWQEVCFRAEDGDQTSHECQQEVAEPVADAGPATYSGEATAAEGSTGIYAAISSGPLDPAHLPPERTDATAPAEGIWFLLFSPDRRPETLWIMAQAPYTWDEALTSIIAARDPTHSELYGYICQVQPQPSAEFASLICLPMWARQRVAVLLDSRSFDGRMYCLTIDPWIQWGSFLLHTGLSDTDDFVVVVNGAARARGRPLILKQGDLIQVLEYGASIPPTFDLGDLMFIGDCWEADPPLAFSSSFSHYWVLHEGSSRGIDADFHAINNVYGFQEFAADALQFAQHRTTLKTASPQIIDGVYKGILCRAVVLVTECLPTIPVPPARLTVPLTVVFLDMRPVLGGFNWRILARGETALNVFTKGLNLEPPLGYHIHIAGGSRTVRKGVTFLQAADRAVLVISYVEQAIVGADPTADDDSSSSSTDFGSNHDAGGPDNPMRDTLSATRSRSPRHNRTKRRNRGNRGGAGSMDPPATLVVAKLDVLVALLKQIAVRDIRTELHGYYLEGPQSPFAPPEEVHKEVCSPAAEGATHKILVEPTGGSVNSAVIMACLRYAAPRLGFPWRYMTPINALRIEDGSDSDSDDDVLPSPPVRVCFRILMPGYDAERVEVSLVFPTTVAEVIPLVQDARCRTRVQNFPRLLPASPQPLIGDGVFIACPAWSVEVATSRRQVCIDCSALDGRLYSALIPPYIYGAGIPDLVNLPSNLEYSVFAGPYGDLLQWDSQCHLVDGDTIFVRPEESAPPAVVPLHVALLGRQHWHRQPEIPEPRSHGICCVVYGADNILHINTRGQRVNLRAQLAASVGVPQQSLRITSSSPRVLYAAVDGFPCRSVIVVSEGAPLGDPALHWVLLDARALFLGWRSIPAPYGQISCRSVIDGLLNEIGSGWRLWLRDVPFSADLIDTREGQIFTVEVIHERLVRPLNGPDAANAPAAAPTVAASNRVADGEPAGIRNTPAAGTQTGSQIGGSDLPTDHAHSDGWDNHQHDNSDLSSVSPVLSPNYTVVPFVVLKQNYDHEWITVRLALGTEIHEALNAAAAARPPAVAVRVPTLCAVHPQPSSSLALAVGLPAWPHPGSIVAIDSRTSNGRLFASQVIGHCYRHDFLKLAGLADTNDYEVYFRDLPWPLPADSPVHPGNGDLVLICPRAARHHVVNSLADMLQSVTDWEPAPAHADNYSDIAWVLGPAGPSALQVPSQRQHRARYDIATHTGILHRDLALSPAFRGVSDFAERGVLMRNVVVARSLHDPGDDNRDWALVCILDLRPILLGFDWVLCPNGIFLPERIQARFLHRCPPGFRLGRIVHDACFCDLQDPFLIQDGDVVTLAFRQLDDLPVNPMPGSPGDNPGPHNRVEGDEQGTLDRSIHPGPTMSSQATSSSPPNGEEDPPSHGSSTGGAVRKYLPRQRYCGRPEVTSSSPHLPICLHKPACVRTPRRLALSSPARCDLLLCCLLLIWSPAGSLLGLIACALALATPVLGQPTGIHNAGSCGTLAFLRFTLVVMCLAHPPNGVLGMQHCGHCANLKDHYMQLSRALPTPVRAGIVRSSPSWGPLMPDSCSPSWPPVSGLTRPHEPSDAACSESPLVRESHIQDTSYQTERPLCLDAPLTTLLEDSIASPGSQAFFLAATLLETIFEHFEQAVHCSSPPAQIRQLRLQEHVPPPSFNLDVDCIQLPHNQSLLRRLMQPWPTEWLLPHDWERDDLPATTRAQLQHAKPWKHLLSSAPSDELSFIIYTDGSATRDGQTSGYAAVIMICTQDAISPLGIIGGRILGCRTSPWVVDCPAALHAEHVALAVAILWCLQMTGVVQCVTCQLCFDCTAAGWSAEGSWQTLSHTGALVHHLDMVARATPGVHLTYTHVRGHSNHPWNDLADFAAKMASQGQIWPTPPQELCEALHAQDITWLAVEQDARSHHAVPIYDGAFMYASSGVDFEPLSPEHLIPITGDNQSSNATTGQHCEAYIATINVQSLRGKCKYIEEQLHSRAVNVACLQETKLDSGTLTSQHYLRIHSRADSHWGVAIWVHKQLGVLCLDDEPLHIDEHDVAVLHESPRMLMLLITKGQLKIGLFSGHCPHSNRPEERDAFLAAVAPLLLRLKHAHVVLGGVDLNGRIPPNFQGVSGSLEFGEADATGWSFANILADSGLWAPSLFSQLHCGDSATYTHPSGKQHRIDYNLLGGQAVLEKVRSEIDSTFDNGSPQDDHMLLGVSLQGYLDADGHTRKLRRARYDRDRLMTSEGRDCLRQKLPSFRHPGWDVSPDQHCRKIEQHISQILDTHFTVPRSLKKASYIPERVWQLRERKLAFKQRVRYRSKLWHDLVCRAFHQWKEHQDYGVIFFARNAK